MLQIYKTVLQIVQRIGKPPSDIAPRGVRCVSISAAGTGDIWQKVLGVNQLQGVLADFALPYLVRGVDFSSIIVQVGHASADFQIHFVDLVLTMDVPAADPDQRRVEEMLTEKALPLWVWGIESFREAHVDCRLCESADAIPILTEQ